MRKMKEDEIKHATKKIADAWLAGFSLSNAKKIAMEVKRVLMAEENRRKEG